MLGRVGPEELEQLPRVGELACLAVWQLVVPPDSIGRSRTRPSGLPRLRSKSLAVNQTAAGVGRGPENRGARGLASVSG